MCFYLDLPLVGSDGVRFLVLVQSQGGLSVRGRDECVHGEAAEQGRLADAVLSAQNHLLTGHLHGRHRGGLWSLSRRSLVTLSAVSGHSLGGQCRQDSQKTDQSHTEEYSLTQFLSD